MTAGIGLIEGRAIPLGRDNIDTDTIIPAAYLKTISRKGLGRHAFAPLRAEPGNLFDDPAYRGAPILIAGENFGCGSSREHAVWAIKDMGIDAVIAASFSDIFAGNAFRNGLVCAALPDEAIAQLVDAARRRPLRVDLKTMRVGGGAVEFAFALDPFRRLCLVEGLVEITVTLASEAAIAAYEAINLAHAPMKLPTSVPGRRA